MQQPNRSNLLRLVVLDLAAEALQEMLKLTPGPRLRALELAAGPRLGALEGAASPWLGTLEDATEVVEKGHCYFGWFCLA